MGILEELRHWVRKIPKGKVATYGEVARAAGHPGAARQVVWALQRAYGLPWHRVLGAGGRICLTGESGFEQRMQLESEGVAFRGSRVAMELHGYEFGRGKIKKQHLPQRTQGKRKFTKEIKSRERRSEKR